jgi:hypothetical protein
MVLEFGHHPFEEIRDLRPAELLAVAAIFRDAVAVLDTISWLPAAYTGPVSVTITPGHFAQLKRRRADVALSVLDRLDGRDELTDPADLAEADARHRRRPADRPCATADHAGLPAGGIAIGHAEHDIAASRWTGCAGVGDGGRRLAGARLQVE